MTSDEPFYAPGYRPKPRQPRPGERVWRLRKAQHHVDAELRDHGKAVGVEIQFLYDGELAYGRCWPTRELALHEATTKRHELESKGWSEGGTRRGSPEPSAGGGAPAP